MQEKKTKVGTKKPAPLAWKRAIILALIPVLGTIIVTLLNVLLPEIVNGIKENSGRKPPQVINIKKDETLISSTVKFNVSVDTYEISVDENGKIVIPLGQTIQITGKTTTQTGEPYPNELSYTYTFSTGEIRSGQTVPYTVNGTATVSINVYDETTHESKVCVIKIGN